MKDAKDMVPLIIKKLMEEGKIMRAGWVGYEHACVPQDAGPAQRRDTEVAFYAGALHLFTAIMHGLDEDKEPTTDDISKMDKISKELLEFEDNLVNMFPELKKAKDALQ